MEDERYKAALERAKSAIKECGDNVGRIKMIESIFPELGESEDERIRRFLHKTFTAQYLAKDKLGRWHNEPVTNILAYLEKQGTQREQLINKACDVLVNCIEDYMLRRMDVWSEECKKQTLENIRKKLEE